MDTMDTIQIVLNDGTIIPDGRVGYAEGFLWCYLTGYTLGQAATLFFDTNRTAKITFVYGEMQDIYEGFTSPFHISTDAGGVVSVGLKRGAQDA